MTAVPCRCSLHASLLNLTTTTTTHTRSPASRKTLEVATRAGADIEERLTLIEASVRVLPAVDPARGSVLLMGLLTPLMHALAQGLQSTTPDEPAVREKGGARHRSGGGGTTRNGAEFFYALSWFKLVGVIDHVGGTIWPRASTGVVMGLIG